MGEPNGEDTSANIHVSDTTAITNLSAIGRLDLIESIFFRILIPLAVFEELTRHGPKVPGAKEVRSCAWIQAQEVSNRALVRDLCRVLDRGEAEAIALAHETGAKPLIIDEYQGRKAAAAMGIPIIGVLGILIEAKNRRLLTAVEPVLHHLRCQAGFRLGKDIVQRVLREVGEA